MQLLEAPLPFAHGSSFALLLAIELFYHPNNFASDVRNVISESELNVVEVKNIYFLKCLQATYISYKMNIKLDASPSYSNHAYQIV